MEGENKNVVKAFLVKHGDAEVFDALAVRFKSRFPEPKSDKPWVCELVLAENMEAMQYKTDIKQLAAIRNDEFHLCPMHSYDGPIVTSFAKGKGKGKVAGKQCKQGKGEARARIWAMARTRATGETGSGKLSSEPARANF